MQVSLTFRRIVAAKRTDAWASLDTLLIKAVLISTISDRFRSGIALIGIGMPLKTLRRLLLGL